MRKYGFISVLSAFLFLVASATIADAQGKRPDYGPVISLANAKAVANATREYGLSKGWNLAVAVVDNHGFLIAFERAENTQTASVQIAVDKARVASMYRRPTAAFAGAMAKGRIAVLSLRGVVASPGGVPIMKDGKVIGAVGVSGARGVDDGEAALAGVAKVKF